MAVVTFMTKFESKEKHILFVSFGCPSKMWEVVGVVGMYRVHVFHLYSYHVFDAHAIFPGIYKETWDMIIILYCKLIVIFVGGFPRLLPYSFF